MGIEGFYEYVLICVYFVFGVEQRRLYRSAQKLYRYGRMNYQDRSDLVDILVYEQERADDVSNRGVTFTVVTTALPCDQACSWDGSVSLPADMFVVHLGGVWHRSLKLGNVFSSPRDRIVNTWNMRANSSDICTREEVTTGIPCTMQRESN